MPAASRIDHRIWLLVPAVLILLVAFIGPVAPADRPSDNVLFTCTVVPINVAVPLVAVVAWLSV